MGDNKIEFESLSPREVPFDLVSVDEKYLVKDGKIYLVERRCCGEVQCFNPPVHVANTFSTQIAKDYPWLVSQTDKLDKNPELG